MIATLLAPSLTLAQTATQAAHTFTPFFGQERFCHALSLACHISDVGHHVFVVNECGAGAELLTPTLAFLDEQRPNTPAQDWIYVHDFTNPKQPKALPMPAGQAIKFANKVHQAYLRCQKTIAQRFDTLSHQQQKLALKTTLQNKENTAIDAFNKKAKPYNLNFDPSSGTHLSPLDGNVKTKDPAPLYPALQKLLHTFDGLGVDYDSAIAQLEQNKAAPIIDRIFAPLIDQADTPALKAYLTDYAKAIDFDDDDDEDLPARFSIIVVQSSPHRPVIYTSAHDLSYLTGQITNNSARFELSVGALHRANGGFLLIQASDLKDNLEAWQALKHALLTAKITPSCDGCQSLWTPTPIPLATKVILLGNQSDYDELMDDDDARYLFGIRADWVGQIDNTAHNQQALLACAHDITKKDNLPPIAKDAYGTLLTALAQRTQDKQKLSLEYHYLNQLIHQSAAIARTQGSDHISTSHLTAAIQAQKDRQGLLARYYWQELKDGRHLISTHGQAVGQINGLSVIDDGFYAFGLPARLTAQVVKGLGEADIYDVERVAHLGGSIHAKAVLIMSGFLKATFSGHCPLNFSAYVAFEQNYEHIDGDSATLAETCALLSALADVPIYQHLAITGSMNQLGQVQAVGGVNAKIEGFFRLCCHQGLDGQGVIIPRANANELILDGDIIQALEQGQFTIYAIDDIFDALNLLCPINASPTQGGKFAKDSLFALIVKRLKKWHKKSRPKATKETP